MKDDKHDLSCEDEDILKIRTEDEKIGKIIFKWHY